MRYWPVSRACPTDPSLTRSFPKDRFRLDEAALEIGVNRPRSPGRGQARRNGPGPDFLFVEGEKGAQPQHLVGGRMSRDTPDSFTPSSLR